MKPELLSQFRANGRETWQSTAEFSIAKLKRLPSVWATEERRIPAGTSPVSGGRDIRYDHSLMPHCVEQMDSADDPDIQTIVIWAAVRDGKTSAVCCNIIGRTVTDDPGGIYSVHPIADDADRFSQNDIEPTIEATPGLRGRFVKAKSRDSGRTIESKKFIGGNLRIIGSGSITKFRGTAVKVLMLHELDALDPEAIYAAFGRQTGFKDAIRVLESTGTYSAEVDPTTGKKFYRSRIEEWFDKGDKRKWFCPCRACGHLQIIFFENIRHPAGQPELSTLHCEACDAAHDDRQWRAMAKAGKWYPTAGLTDDQQADILANYRLARASEPHVRSYWRNGFCNLFPHGKGFKSKLHQFVAEAESAKSSPEALEKWETEVAARLWNPDSELEPPPNWQPLFDRREDYSTPDAINGDRGYIIVPRGGLVLCAGMDVHPFRVEISWVAFGRHEEAWVLDHRVIDGDTHKPDIWDILRKELQREFEHATGARIGLTAGLIDAGYGAEDVFRFLQSIPAAGKLRACRGASKWPHPLIAPYRRGLSGNLSGHYIGGDVAKDIIYSRARMLPNEDGSFPTGWIHYGKRLQKNYFEQKFCERVTCEIVKGVEQRRYKNLDHARNETLDTFIYAFAAFKRRPWNLDAMEKEILASAAQIKLGKKKPETESLYPSELIDADSAQVGGMKW